MKKLIAILLSLLLLCGCAVPNDADTTQTASTNEQTQTEEPVETPVPGPTPVPELTIIALPAEVAFNAGVLSETGEDGVYYVTLPEEEQMRPGAPTYTWYINGTDADAIDEVVIEFDVFGTVRPLDGIYFGYDEAFYLILHNFETIPALPVWPCDPVTLEETGGNTDQNAMLMLPELGVDLKKYAEWEGEHVRIAIPYSEFKTASKDLTLQFLPGTTFGNLSIYLLGTDGLYEDEIERISQIIEAPERDLMNEVTMPLMQKFNERYEFNPYPFNQNPYQQLESNIYRGTNPRNIMRMGSVINPDGSISMPTAFYDLGDYASQVQGKYAVVPEGLVAALATLSSQHSFNDEQRLRVINFILENMMDEGGQFFGIYDIEQQKLVATDRKVATLPMLSALAGYRNFTTDADKNASVISNDTIDLIANSMLANEIVRVGDTLYYAPYGISEDGVMNLKLSDFIFTGGFFGLLTDYSHDGSRLDEEYGCAILLEGLANSLKLILEGQEQNTTHLPSAELRVVFSDDGESYELQPSGMFDIKNSYFSIGLMSFESYYNTIDQFRYEDGDIQDGIDWVFIRLKTVKKGAYTKQQEKTIRDLEALYAEKSNAYTIANTLFESWLDVYNFLRVQTSDTIYANAYNVDTGEVIEASTDGLYTDFQEAVPFVKRFGAPAASMNYFLLVGIFNDESMAIESGNLAQANLDMHVAGMFHPQLDHRNPDLYADNGFNIWGYDSLLYSICCGNFTARMQTRHLLFRADLNLSRENWLVFSMRKMNQFMQEGLEPLTPEDAFPTFYEQIPAVTIEN
jgi:hypothetical protein